MRNRPKFQFGFSTLFWFVTFGMILTSTAFTCFEALWWTVIIVLAILALFCAFVVAAEAFSWIKNPDPNADTHGEKLSALFRSRSFRRAFYIGLFLAFGLNLIPYYRSYGAYGGDGVEVVGWPFYFFERGGFTGYERFNTPALIIDLQVLIVVAAIIGISYRNGIGPVFGRARRLFRKVRTWPYEDDG